MDFITGTAQPPRFFIRFGCTLPDAVLPVGLVYGEVNHHAPAHKVLQQKLPCKSDVFLKGKFILQGNVKAVCKLGVLSTLGFFHGVP